MHRTLLVSALLLLGFGCAPAASPASAPAADRLPPTASDAAPLAASAAIRGFSFTPTEIHVKAGGTVTWTNEHGATHLISADNGAFESPRLARGQSFAQTFPDAGTFSYHCGIHPAMKGTVIVE